MQKIFNPKEYQFYLSILISVSTELARLLNTRFIPHQNVGGLLSRITGQILIKLNQKDFESVARELTKLSLLCDELKDIEKYNVGLLKKFQTVYKKKRMEYFGFRLEVATASMLIRNKMNFEKSERPDYIINTSSNKKIKIECCTSHLSKLQDKDISYKIQSAINKKLKHNYLDNESVLFLDITNLIHHSIVTNNCLYQESIESTVKEAMKNSDLGSVCIFFYMLDKDKDFYGHHHSTRVDNDNISSSLLDFLNKYFTIPDGSNVISNYATSSRP